MNKGRFRLLRIPRSVALVVIGGLLSVVAALLVERSNQAHIKEAVGIAAGKAAEDVWDRISIYQFGLQGARGAVTAIGLENVKREDFKRYMNSRPTDVEFPGARGFGVIFRVPREQESEFVLRARADNFPTFAVRQLNPPNPGDRYIITYIEPVDRNLAAVGLDIASENQRRTAAESAMRTGSPVLTGPITLVQASGNPQQSFLLLLPIYKSGHDPGNEAERVAQAIGWTYTPLLMKEVMAGLRLDNKLFHLKLSDITDPSQTQAFYQSDDDGLAIAHTQVLTHDVFGRTWQLAFSVHPGFVSQLGLMQPVWVLSLGWGVTLLLSAMVGLMSVSRERKTLFLGEQARLAAIVEGSSDAIIGMDLNGMITSWNPGAERMLGFSSNEVMGKRVADALVPEALRHEELMILSRVANGERIPPFETQRFRADGYPLNVTVAASPIVLEGEIVGISKTLHDISSLKQAEHHILELNAGLERQVEQRVSELAGLNRIFGSVLNACSEVSIISTDTAGVIKLFNKGAENLLGYDAGEMVDFASPAVFHEPAEVHKRAQELSEIYGFPIDGFRVFVHVPEFEGAETREWTYIRKNGTRLLVSLSVSAIRDEAGKVTGYLGVAYDITEQRQALQSLAASLETTRAILDTAVTPIITIDAKGLIRSINPAGVRAFGYLPGEVIGQNVKMLMPEPYKSMHDGYLQRYHTENTARIIGIGREVVAMRKDGRLFPVHLSVGQMQINGEVLYVGMLADISEQHRQRDELIATRDQVVLASEVAHLGIWKWTPVQNELEWNDQMLQIYGLPEDQRGRLFAYEDWRRFLHPDDCEEVEQRFADALAGGPPFELVFRIVRADGSVRYMQAAARIDRDEAGQPLRVIGINLDITDQRELEAALRQAKAQSDAASEAKSSFLANMSHEIRTPMNAVLGMLQLIQSTELDTLQQDYVSKAYSASRSLLGILNDILDYSKIESGKLELEMLPFDLEVLMRELAVVLSGNQGDKDVEVMLSIDPALPRVLIGDSLRLKQVLINLAGNALKFTPQGNVIVQVQLLENMADQVRLRIAVTDTGIGISEAQRERIFQGFTQAEASTSRRFGGSGLGLAISRRIIEQMGGELQLNSELGRGSCFWFDLQMKQGELAPMAKSIAVNSVKPRVLIVDDNSVSGEILVDMCATLGCQPEFAPSGFAAVEKVSAALDAGKPYDLVLMDWKMPELDGLQTTQFIKQRAQANAPVVMMISAHGREKLRADATASGVEVTDILTKPFTPQQLAEKLQRLMGGAKSEPAPATSIRELPRRLAGIKLLVVEDNALNRQVAEALLQQEGANVTLAEGGLQGVATVTATDQRFDLVVMDMQMPDIDGLEATRRIRADERFSTLPILAMTANVSTSDREACLAAGMNGHVGKPIDVDQLVSSILALTTNNRAASLVAHAPTPLEAASDEPLVEPLEVILRRYGGREALFRKLLESFMPEQAQLLSDLQDKITQANRTEAIRILHSMKGSAASMGAKQLSQRAAKLEANLKSDSETPLDQFLTRSVMEELKTCLEGSSVAFNRLLGVAIDPEQASLEPVRQTELTWDQWMTQLKELLKLLESGNLRAIEVVEQLPLNVPDTLKETVSKVVQHVLELNFEAAKLTLEVWLEVPRE